MNKKYCSTKTVKKKKKPNREKQKRVSIDNIRIQAERPYILPSGSSISHKEFEKTTILGSRRKNIDPSVERNPEIP